MPVPSQPTIGLATAVGATSASVNFTAPTDTGGLPILSYTATATSQSTGSTITSTLSQSASGTIFVTGLLPSTSYTFTVIATNLDGNSLPSSASNSTTTAGLKLFPAVDFCNNLVIGSLTDWCLPSKNELEIAYYNLKPSTQTNNISSGANPNSIRPRSNYTQLIPERTTNALFQTSGNEAFNSNPGIYYWTSSEINANNVSAQSFNNGEQTNLNKTTLARVRAVRRIPVPVGFSVPGAPILGTVTLSGTTATIPFNPPNSNGNCEIIEYEAISTTNPTLKGTFIGAGAGSINIGGLTLGVTHQFTVRARNLIGIGANSSPSNGVTLTVPFNTVVPTISGNIQIGQTITVNEGTWTGTPIIVYTYQWQRGLTTTSYSDINGATGKNYGIVTADFNNFLRCKVIGTNSGGTDFKFSVDSAKITSLPPSNTGIPVISGTAEYSNTLTVSNGTWDGIPAPTFTYQWQRGTDNIQGATSVSYVVTIADTLKTLRCVVTATNIGGSSSQASSNIPLTGEIPAVPPSNSSIPTISGTVFIGEILTINNGTWIGTPTISFTYQWQRGQTDITGATNSTYTVNFPDYDNTLRCIVTAKNPANSTTGIAVETANTIKVPPAPPVNTGLPVITGDVRVTQTLSCSPGTWTGTETITYTYQWQRGSTNISGATLATYEVQLVDVNSTLRCVVTAKNPANTTTGISATSLSTITVPVMPPRNDALPVISISAAGPYVSGGYSSTLSVTTGTWFGSSPITYSYKWQRITVNANNEFVYTDISGATNNSYVIKIEDTGFRLRCVVKGTNTGGNTEAISVNYPSTGGTIAKFAPMNFGLPVITGTATSGSTLTVSTGTWVGTAPVTFSYQWQRDQVDIPNATENTYTIGIPDTLKTIRCKVTGFNDASTSGVIAYSARVPTSGQIPAVGPSNTDQPTISGTVLINQTLTANPNSWIGTPTINFTYQWRKGSPNNLVPIAGATNRTYVVKYADRFNIIDVVVTASNPGGTASRESLATEEVPDAIPPQNTNIPTISGTVAYNNVITIDKGDWSGTEPITYAYQWQRGILDGGANFTFSNITGATAQNYTVQVEDTLNKLRCLVTAFNAATIDGGVVQASEPVPEASTIPAIAPQNIVRPTISGVIGITNTVEVLPNTWIGSGTVTYSYQWLRNGNAISGATSKTYTITTEDYTTKLSALVTAKNIANNTTGVSTSTLESVPVPPYKTVFNPGPTISGTLAITNTLTVELGTYLGVPEPVFSYQWQANSTNIPNATNASYTVTANEYDKVIRCVVTAKNLGGDAVINSAVTAKVPPRIPSIATVPLISGTVAVNQVLTSTTGVWNATPSPTYTYQWKADDANVGTNSSTYTVTLNDFDKPITCTVTATNIGGATSASSADTINVPGLAPTVSTAPVTSGIMRVYENLTVTSGVWTGTPTIKYAYLWQRDGQNINTLDTPLPDQGASNSYTLTPDDYNTSIRVVVYAHNTGGFTTTTVTFSGKVAGVAPSNLTLPTITGNITPTFKLSINEGSWRAVPAITSYQYQWSKGQTLLVTTEDYTVPLADVGAKLKCRVTAVNIIGSGTATTEESIEVPSALAPSNNALPEISGNFVLDGAVTTTTGEWSGTGPFTYSVQWFRQNENTVLGTGVSYTIKMADTGRSIYSKVTATGPGGSNVASSEISPVITSVAPSNTAIPVVSGTAVYNNTLTVTNGTWTGTTPLNFTYQWKKGDDDIAGATSNTFKLTYNETNATVNVRVTATNDAGESSAVSASYPASGVIPAIKPILVTGGAPTLSVTQIRVGEEISVTDGSWTGTPGSTFTYQWTADGTNINLATGPSLTVPSSAYNKFLRCIVTATNAAGSTPTTVTSAGLKVLNQILVKTEDPEFRQGGNPISILAVGDTIDLFPGSYTGFPTPSYTYYIQVFDTSSLTWSDLGGAVGTPYVIPSSVFEKNIRLRVVAASAVDTLTSFSSESDSVGPQTLSVITNPTLTLQSGTLVPGGVLRWNAGTYKGTPQPEEYSVELERKIGEETSIIDTFTTSTGTYTLTNDDYNATLRINVTATVQRLDLSASASSSYTAKVGARPIQVTTIPTITISDVDITAESNKFGKVYTVDTGVWNGWPELTFKITLYRKGTTNTKVAEITVDSENPSLVYQLENADWNQKHFATVNAKNSANTTGVNSNSAETALFVGTTDYVGDPPYIGSNVQDQFYPESEVRVGNVLRVYLPTYTLLPTRTVSYTWQRGSGTNWTTIGTNSNTYTVLAADEAGINTIRCSVKFTKTSLADLIKITASTADVEKALSPPVFSTKPGLSAITVFGTLTKPNPTVTGNPTPDVTHIWQQSTSTAATAPTADSDWTDVSSEGSITTVATDALTWFRVKFTAENSQGEVSYVTPGLKVAGVAPKDGGITINGIDGAPKIGDTLQFTATLGPEDKLGAPPPTITGKLSYGTYSSGTTGGMSSTGVVDWKTYTQTGLSETGAVMSISETIPAEHYGRVYRYTITATNGVGTGFTYTAYSTRVIHQTVPTHSISWASPDTALVDGGYFRSNETLTTSHDKGNVPSMPNNSLGVATSPISYSYGIEKQSGSSWVSVSTTSSWAVGTLDVASIGVNYRAKATLSLPALTYRIYNYSTKNISATDSTAPAWNSTVYTPLIISKDKVLGTEFSSLPSISGDFIKDFPLTINIGSSASGWRSFKVDIIIAPNTVTNLVNNQTSLPAGGNYTYTPTTTMTIGSVRVTWYNASSESSINEGVFNQEILGGGRPGQVGDITFSSITQTSAVVSWGGADPNGHTITSYKIKVTISGATTDYTSTEGSLTISGLTASSTYTVAISAVNRVGEGTSKSATLTTSPNPPQFGPTGISVLHSVQYNTDKTESAIAKITWSSPTSGYSYVNVRTVINDQLINSENITTTGTTITRVLTQFQTYVVFQIALGNGGGLGPYTNFPTTTAGAPPPAPPDWLYFYDYVLSDTDTSAGTQQVKWDPSPNPNGVDFFYRLVGTEPTATYETTGTGIETAFKRYKGSIKGAHQTWTISTVSSGGSVRTSTTVTNEPEKAIRGTPKMISAEPLVDTYTVSGSPAVAKMDVRITIQRAQHSNNIRNNFISYFFEPTGPTRKSTGALAYHAEPQTYDISAVVGKEYKHYTRENWFYVFNYIAWTYPRKSEYTEDGPKSNTIVFYPGKRPNNPTGFTVTVLNEGGARKVSLSWTKPNTALTGTIYFQGYKVNGPGFTTDQIVGTELTSVKSAAIGENGQQTWYIRSYSTKFGDNSDISVSTFL